MKRIVQYCVSAILLFLGLCVIINEIDNGISFVDSIIALAFFVLPSVILFISTRKESSRSKKSKKEEKPSLDSLPSPDYYSAQISAVDLITKLLENVEIVNSTIDVDKYFSTYDECFVLINDLIPYEQMQKLPFKGDKPSSMLKSFTEKKQASLHYFLERSAKAYASLVFDDSTCEKQNAYESFCQLLRPYYSRFDAENQAFLENECKEIFYSFSMDDATDNEAIAKKAINIVLTCQVASTTMLQRKLRLGYARAARTMDCLEEIGIVEPAEGSAPRKVLISKDEYFCNRTYYEDLIKEYYSVFEKTTEETSASESQITKGFDDLDGYEFESYCCKVLAANNYSNIEQTKLSGDDGIDIIAEKEGIRYGFQCKCYSSPVGIKAVQEAFTGAKMYNCDVAVVITNNRFTQQAIHAAEQTRVRLWDRSKLIEMATKV